ncbi:inorganic phosphate transporter [Candidatus Purcelliella pentastirinorum]|nr:inorganic phosphate transporter [Candidatus Purcelliella pentastirinorum]
MFEQCFIYNIQNIFVLSITLIFVLFYEIINGFHDTANSVVTLIYTKTMEVKSSVILSSIFNFFGVLFGGLTVAYAIIHLFTINLLIDIISVNGLKVIFSILLSSIIWNLITWYFGFPSSSSHALIGSIIGINLIHSFINNISIFNILHTYEIINVLLSLIFSPIIGLLLSGTIIILLRKFLINNSKYAYIHMTPLDYYKRFGIKKPPFWIRLFIIFFSVGVSYAHGSNDGQKGIGLIMLILICIMPGCFVLNLNSSCYEIMRTRNSVNNFKDFYEKKIENEFKIICSSNSYTVDINNVILLKKDFHDNLNIYSVINFVQLLLSNLLDYNSLSFVQRINLRFLLIYVSNYINQILNRSDISCSDKQFLNIINSNILYTIEYAPIWIFIIVAISLSFGTILGWKRVTLTMGKKIGRKNTTYAQSISSQITSSFAIVIASYFGIPVSTTHIISSSIAGSMLFDKVGLQFSIIKSIFLTWVLTLPISILFSIIFYLFFLKI